MKIITEAKYRKLPEWIKRIYLSTSGKKIPSKLVYILISLLSSIWFLVRVIPKPSRASYPCMQVAFPVISGFLVWIFTLSGTVFAFRKAKRKLNEAKYFPAFLFFIVSISAAVISSTIISKETNAQNLEIWYKPNIPLGVAKGIFPGRVSWGHNPKIASWDGTTGFWWEDKFNDQKETNKLLTKTLLSLTGSQNEKESWNSLFIYFNNTKLNQNRGYQSGEKIAIKINENNASSHESSNEINANPQLILSLLTSLIKEAGIQEENITVADPSRFITNNIFDKCHAVFPKVHFVDHNGGDGREKATFVENAIQFSVDNGKVAKGIASCFMEANYIINLALMKGHNAQGVTLCGKNYFGCTSIESDWRKNAHSDGFSQSKEGKRRYSVYTDYLGHKNLGEKTILFLIDGIYGNKFVNGVPTYRWLLAPFNNQWPNSLFASQDGVAIDAVVLDFALAEWPDAPDMKYSDFYLEESALAFDPPSKTFYDPERTGNRLKSLGVTEHWNNFKDKQYSRNLKSGNGIELIYAQTNEMLLNGNFNDSLKNWAIEQSMGATSQIDFVKEGPNNTQSLRLKINTIAEQPWRIQLFQPGIKVEKGKNYILSFWVKSKEDVVISVNCMQNHEPWAHPTQQPITVSTEWKQILFAFNAAWDEDNARITFTNLGTTPGQTYWFANCSLTQK